LTLRISGQKASQSRPRFRPEASNISPNDPAPLKGLNFSIKHLKFLILAAAFILFAVCGEWHSYAADGRSIKTKTPVPDAGSIERLEYEIIKGLGKSNRKMDRITHFQVDGQDVVVHFTINDNLTVNMTKGGAKNSAESILKAVQNSGYDYSTITMLGTYPLQDKLGNSTETGVLQATYSRGIVSRINWQGFLYDNVYEIADEVWLHPAFK